jgi:cytochrome d ubiquinol oxidase subunit I
MALVGLWVAWAFWRYGDVAAHRRLLLALGLVTPFGFIATEAGWIVTEVGRQPWVVYGVMRTADAVTPMPGLTVPLVVFTAVYLALGAVTWVVLRAMVRDTAGPWIPLRTGEFRGSPPAGPAP